MSDATRRHCGDCTACCKTCPVEGLGKPVFVPCKHLSQQGPPCAIYSDRPDECAAYHCSWLEGLFGPEHRPDLSGIVFETTYLKHDDGRLRVTVYLGLAADPAQKDDEEWRAIIGELVPYIRKGSILCLATGIEHNAHRVFGHPTDVQIWTDFMARAQHQGFTDVDDKDGRSRIALKTSEIQR